jgi:hypothetical protein
MQKLSRIPAWQYAAIAGLFLALQIGVLHWEGQPAFAASGHIRLWEGNPFSIDNSQQFADWYSLSHIVHGILFYALLRLAAPRLPFAARLLLAMTVEVSWEIFENTQFMIHAYRTQALAVGYSGDSILNSLSDTLMMCTGFFIASRLPWWLTVALAVALEAVAAAVIRDNLSLNILNFVHPIAAISRWQAGFHP